MSTVVAEVGGEELEFRLCLWGLILAEQRGLDLANVPADEDDARDKLDQALQQGFWEGILETLWIARLPYDPDLKQRELGMMIGFGDLDVMAGVYEEIITCQMSDDVREKIEEARDAKKKAKAD